MDAEIFTGEELEKFECMQKMINIYKIGQLTQVKLIAQSGKYSSNSNVQSLKGSSGNEQVEKIRANAMNNSKKKLVKLYDIIKHQLKGFGRFSNLLAMHKKHSKPNNDTSSNINHEYSFTLNHPESIE